MKINPSMLADLKNTAGSADNMKEAKLKKACNDFEAIILKQLLTTMRKSIPKDGLFSGGFADDMYQSMSDDELTKNMAHGRGMGLSDVLYAQLSGNMLSKPEKG